MKTLVASLILISVFCPNVSAQTQEKPSALGDQAIIDAWVEHANQSKDARIEDDRLILPTDDSNATCAFLRVYRMKRDFAGSDTTRPAGYTTCVGVSRFSMKSSVTPVEGVRNK